MFSKKKSDTKYCVTQRKHCMLLFVTNLFVFQFYFKIRTLVDILGIYRNNRNHYSKNNDNNKNEVTVAKQSIRLIQSCECHEYIDDAGNMFMLKQLELVYRKWIIQMENFSPFIMERVHTKTVFSYRTQQLLEYLLNVFVASPSNVFVYEPIMTGKRTNTKSFALLSPYKST